MDEVPGCYQSIPIGAIIGGIVALIAAAIVIAIAIYRTKNGH